MKEITEMISSFKNYPILFVGSGFSKRYGDNALSWPELLKKMSLLIYGNNHEYDQMYEKYKNDSNPLISIASQQEKDYTNICNERLKEQEYINGLWDNIKDNKPSRYKILLHSILKEIKIKENRSTKIDDEINGLIRASKNIMSVVTTNYDTILEEIIEYLTPSIGNDIYFSNIYGSIYKIHGDISNIENAKSLIITKEDYEDFYKNYKLIKSHLISLFIHNPIIFIGYSIQDENIQDILNTIFMYVDINSEQGQKIKNNFLLIEWEENSENLMVEEHTLMLKDRVSISINKLKTDNYQIVYDQIESLMLTANALEIKKAMSYFYEVSTKADRSINFEVTSTNGPSMSGVVIKDSNTVEFKNNIPIREVLKDYFSIIETNDKRYKSYVPTKNKYMYFPVWGFNKIIGNTEILQIENTVISSMENKIKTIGNKFESCSYNTVMDIFNDISLSKSNKIPCIFYNVYNDYVSYEGIKDLLKKEEVKDGYNLLITIYDFKNHK